MSKSDFAPLTALSAILLGMVATISVWGTLSDNNYGGAFLAPIIATIIWVTFHFVGYATLVEGENHH